MQGKDGLYFAGRVLEMVKIEQMTAYVKRADLARDRSEQRTERFAVGEKFDAKVTLFDSKARKMNVSIKALEIADERDAVAQYGSSDSGASLGDIFKAAIKKKEGDDKKEADDKKDPPKNGVPNEIPASVVTPRWFLGD